MIVLRRTRYLVDAPPKCPILHAATYLRRSPGWGHARTFARFNREVETQLETTSGALAYSLQRLLIGGEVWTLSLWTDRKSLLGFIREGSHRSAAAWLRATEENAGKFAQWETVQPTLNIDDAYVALESPRPKGRVLRAPTPIPKGWRAVPR